MWICSASASFWLNNSKIINGTQQYFKTLFYVCISVSKVRKVNTQVYSRLKKSLRDHFNGCPHIKINYCQWKKVPCHSKNLINWLRTYCLEKNIIKSFFAWYACILFSFQLLICYWIFTNTTSFNTVVLRIYLDWFSLVLFTLVSKLIFWKDFKFRIRVFLIKWNLPNDITMSKK